MSDSVFNLPDLGEGLIEATVLEVFVTEGEYVERNAPLLEVETSKSATELPSPNAGRITTVHVAAGEHIKVGAPLVTFEQEQTAGIVGTVPQQESPRRSVRLRPPQP